jgi:hypothetical protein
MSNNSHLIPAVVQDIIDKLKVAHGNEKMMLEARLQAIVDAGKKALKID